MPEFQMPTFTPSRPTRITRRPVVHFNGHVNPLPLATVPAQSDAEKALHLDPEYAELIRSTVSGHREYRERDPHKASWPPLRGSPTTYVPLSKTSSVYQPKRVNARALAEREGWTPGVLLSSSRWRNGSRKLLEVCADGVWITEGERGARGRGGKRCLVDTLPQDTRAVEP